jgi:hypothetical protein
MRNCGHVRCTCAANLQRRLPLDKSDCTDRRWQLHDRNGLEWQSPNWQTIFSPWTLDENNQIEAAAVSPPQRCPVD